MGVYGDLFKLNETKYVAQPLPREERSAVPVQEEPGAAETPTTVPPRSRVTNHDTTPPRNRGSKTARYHDTMLHALRTAVKRFGKEAATHRFTIAEKKVIADLVYTYRQRDVRTSENEITRIGVNFILRDYQENGKRSLLHRVIMALHR